MSRIRSIHPGLWTDEAFVSLSPIARLLFIALWNECDDKGLFPWSPLQLKMRCLPGDNCDAAELLGEIEAAGFVRRYDFEGKSLGAVRNFGRFQRPKKPNDIHPASAEILRFAGMNEELIPAYARMVPNQFPTSGEIAPQMEEGGDKGSSEAIASAAIAANDVSAIDATKTIFATGRAILKADGKSDREAGSIIGRWRKTYSDSAVLAVLSRCQVEQPEVPIEWIPKALQAEQRRAIGQGHERLQPASPTTRQLGERLAARFG